VARTELLRPRRRFPAIAHEPIFAYRLASEEAVRVSRR
jgi:hypothetical protein